MSNEGGAQSEGDSCVYQTGGLQTTLQRTVQAVRAAFMSRLPAAAVRALLSLLRLAATVCPRQLPAAECT